MTTSPAPRTSTRRGFTLAEVMIALVVFGVVSTAVFGFLLGQGRGFRKLATRSQQIQNGRFGRDIMRQELRATGTNVAEDQPMVVYAGDSVFAFNADLTTNRLDSTAFTGAVYVDEYASDAEVSSIALANAITIPGTSFTYPLRDYGPMAGMAGDAETVIFRFTRDTTSSSTLDRMLLRQVNGGAPEIIATGLRQSQSIPFFRYWYDPSRYNQALTELDTVPRGWLPLAKTVAARGVTPDTGVAVTTRIDQIRGVEVTYEATPPSGGTRNVVRYVVPLPNTMSPRQSRACGRPPIVPSAPTVTWNADSNAVLLSWNRAVDDGAGENDAVRYVMWRRLTGDPQWGTPFATVSAVGGSDGYSYKDGGVEQGLNRSYQYALALQDCTPNLSGIAGSGSVVVP
jgi:prepilin-type N-terminal cleavage/methylation domain-containing protein